MAHCYECLFGDVILLTINLKGRLCDLLSAIIIKVPAKGIEPSLSCENQILSLARLPIPPHGLKKRSAIIRCVIVTAKQTLLAAFLFRKKYIADNFKEFFHCCLSQQSYAVNFYSTTFTHI